MSSLSTLSVSPDDTLSPHEWVSPDDTPLLERTSPQRVTDRNVSIDEKHRDTPAAYGLTVCECDGYTDCVALNNREETA